MEARVINKVWGRVIGVLLFYPFTCLPSTAQTYTLRQLTDSALLHNNAVQAARYDIAAASEQRREAFTKYFPTVSGTAAWFNASKHLVSTDVNPGDYLPSSLAATLAQTLPAEALAALSSPISISMLKNGTLAGINAVQPVFAGGQMVNGNRLAKVGEDVSRLKLQLSENEVVMQTEQYYWQLVSLEEKMKTVGAVEELLADIHKDVDVAVRAGVAMRNDLLQVQLRQNEVESQKVKLQNGMQIVRMLLGQYAGLTPAPSPTGEGGAYGREWSGYSFNVVVPDSGAAKPPLGEVGRGLSLGGDDREAFSESGVSLLPEYQLLQKQVEAAELQRRMELGSRLPSVAVGAGYNYNNLMDRNMSFGMVFATVSVPISDWWGGSHAMKRKKIELQKAQDELADNAELLRIRMQKAWNDVQESRQQLQIAQRSVEQAEENLRLNRDYYRAGTSKMTDLLEAQLLYQQACDARVDAMADCHLKLTAYRQATGQLR
ncbi:MAG: TolC family protein [Prevotella sp.]|nr:TolC family protein [Prevotella sp.]